MIEDELKLLTIDEIVDLLRISKATIHKLISKKAIIPVKIGGRTLFSRQEVRRFIERQTHTPLQGEKRGRKPKKKTS